MKVRRLALVAGVLPVLAMTACGGGAKTPSVASAGTPSTVSSASASPTGTSDPLKFAQCMREHGIDMEDPEPGGGIRIGIKKGQEGKMEKAQKACGHFMQGGGPGGDGPEDPKMRDAALKFARCMREHGVDMPDPEPGGGIVMRRDKNTDEGAVERAHKACETLLPGGGPKAGGGPGTVGGPETGGK